jgi:hypothetical protein
MELYAFDSFYLYGPPTAPCNVAGLVLRDLTMINEVPKLLDNGHINFRKLSCIYGVIKSVERFQVCKAGFNRTVPPCGTLCRYIYSGVQSDLWPLLAE